VGLFCVEQMCVHLYCVCGLGFDGRRVLPVFCIR